MAAQQDSRNFQEMFGGATADVDFAMPADHAVQHLAVPEPSENLETTVRKLEALARVVQAGKSIAVRTGYVVAKQRERDPAAITMAAMTPAEREQYEVWARGIKNHQGATSENKDLVGGTMELNEMELAEIQTAHRVNAVATNNMNMVFQRMRQLSRRLNHSKDIIQAREYAIKAKMPHYKNSKIRSIDSAPS